MKRIGTARFQELFESKVAVQVTETLHHALTVDPDVYEQARPLFETQTLKPYQATLKV